jgi:hypothetical protein
MTLKTIGGYMSKNKNNKDAIKRVSIRPITGIDIKGVRVFLALKFHDKIYMEGACLDRSLLDFFPESGVYTLSYTDGKAPSKLIGWSAEDEAIVNTFFNSRTVENIGYDNEDDSGKKAADSKTNYFFAEPWYGGSAGGMTLEKRIPKQVRAERAKRRADIGWSLSTFGDSYKLGQHGAIAILGADSSGKSILTKSIIGHANGKYWSIGEREQKSAPPTLAAYSRFIHEMLVHPNPIVALDSLSYISLTAPMDTGFGSRGVGRDVIQLLSIIQPLFESKDKIAFFVINPLEEVSEGFRRGIQGGTTGTIYLDSSPESDETMATGISTIVWNAEVQFPPARGRFRVSINYSNEYLS